MCKFKAAAALALALFAPTGLSFAGQASFTPLELLPGGTSSIATELSRDGSTVTGTVVVPSSTYPQVVRWQLLGAPEQLGSTQGLVYHVPVSGGGGVAAFFEQSHPTRSYRWMGAGPRAALSPMGGTNDPRALAVSADGRRIAGVVTGSNFLYQGVLWTGSATTPTALAILPQAISSYPGAFLPDGSIIGNMGFTTNTVSLVRWSGASVTPIADFSAYNPRGPFSVRASAFGDFIGGGATTDSSGLLPWRWTASIGFQTLPLLAGDTDGSVSAIAADGTMVGGSGSLTGDHAAALWTPDGTVHPLESLLEALGVDLQGFTLVGANGISDDGLTIAGIARDPSGHDRAFVATIPAVPSLAPVCVAAAVIGVRRRR